MARRSKRIQNRIPQNRIDRLSDLPDCLLHEILSLVDTRSSVQTSILSRRWKSVWKDVPVLNFSSKFRSDVLIEREVDRVLTLRSESSSVGRVTVDFSLEEERMMVLFVRIMKHTASHGVEELSISSSIIPSLGVFELLCDSYYKSLKVLELNREFIRNTDVGLFSRLQLLKSLTLTACLFPSGVAPQNVLNNFPRLETLKLDSCSYYDACVLIVNAPKLLNLEIVSPKVDVLEIDAPKLQSFTLKIDSPNYILPEVSESNLPSLNRANIELMAHKFLILPACATDGTASERQLLLERCVNLFKVLHNVQVLNLQVETLELLIQACNLVKHQSSPFKRMKSVNLKFCEGSSFDIPDQMIPYFLGSSPTEEDKSFTVEQLR